jgi:hypothetical protein
MYELYMTGCILAKLSITLLVFSVFHSAIIFWREQARSERDWLVMTSVLLASQSSCFFLSSREQIHLMENRLEMNKIMNVNDNINTSMQFFISERNFSPSCETDSRARNTDGTVFIQTEQCTSLDDRGRFTNVIPTCAS